MKSQLIRQSMMRLENFKSPAPLVTENEFLAVCGLKNTERSVSMDIKGKLREVLEGAPALTYPKALVKTYSLSAVEQDSVLLSTGNLFQGKLIGKFLEGSSWISIVCLTIGSALENESDRLFSDKLLLKGYLLDTYGSIAVLKFGKLLLDSIAKEAELLCLNASVALSPGDFGWSLKDQVMLLQLVDAKRIHVTLTKGFVMDPIKSLTFIVGVGKGVQEKHQSSCAHCSCQDHCAFKGVYQV